MKRFTIILSFAFILLQADISELKSENQRLREVELKLQELER